MRPAHPRPARRQSANGMLSIVRSVVLAVVVGSALAGCVDGPGSSHVVRTQVDGRDAFHSRARLMPASARFECLSSDSGHCHYAVFGGACGSVATTLGSSVLRCRPDAEAHARFSLAVGERREVDGLPLDYRHCASSQPEPMIAACLQPIAIRSPAT